MTFFGKTFRRGTHPPARKITADMPLAEFDAPERLYFALAQHIGAPAQPVVSEGERVLAGQLIAEAAGYVSACVHSSVSGTVAGIKELPTATGGKCRHIEIINDFAYESVSLPPLADPSAEEIIARVRECGIIGMGGAGFPTHVKLAPKNAVDTLVLNGAECEPYITCDCRLMTERAAEVVRGAELLMTALGAGRTLIGVEANKKEAFAALSEACAGNAAVTPVLLRTKYPQGAEKQLVFALTRRQVPPGGLPADVGCVVDNVHTAYAVARAVDKGEPLYMRAVTVSGGAAGVRGNFMMRTGIPFSFVREKTRGETSDDDVAKVISGGPMMGFAQAGLDACVTKGTSSVLFMDGREAAMREPTQCINCGRCIRQCPMKLMPRDIEKAVLSGDFARTEELFVASCMECGVCSYVCPAKRPLVQAIRLAKKTLKEGRAGK